MTPQEALVALHDALGTWRKVATACNAPLRANHPGAYYRKVAFGLIHKPSRAALYGIGVASDFLLGVNVTAVTSPRRRVARKNVFSQP